LFYEPGTATRRAVAEIYNMMELSPLVQESESSGRGGVAAASHVAPIDASAPAGGHAVPAQTATRRS